jgi:hypothetical protein
LVAAIRERKRIVSRRAIIAAVTFVFVLALLLVPWPGLASLSTHLFTRALSAWCVLCFRGHDFRVVLSPHAQAWAASPALRIKVRVALPALLLTVRVMS